MRVMRHFMLVLGGNPTQTHVYFRMSSPDGGLQLRPRYAGLACRACGKFDEYAALDLGIDDDVKVSSRRDLTWTFDFCHVAGPRFREVYERAGCQGLAFIPLPKSRAPLWVIRPMTVAATDPARTQMQLVGEPCAACGRYGETCFSPALASMAIPTDPMVIFSPRLRTEKRNCAMTQLIVSEPVFTLLKEARLTGIDWTATRVSYG